MRGFTLATIIMVSLAGTTSGQCTSGCGNGQARGRTVVNGQNRDLRPTETLTDVQVVPRDRPDLRQRELLAKLQKRLDLEKKLNAQKIQMLESKMEEMVDPYPAKTSNAGIGMGIGSKSQHGPLLMVLALLGAVAMLSAKQKMVKG